MDLVGNRVYTRNCVHYAWIDQVGYIILRGEALA